MRCSRVVASYCRLFCERRRAARRHKKTSPSTIAPFGIDCPTCYLCNIMALKTIFGVTELTFQGFEATFKALDASVKGFDDKIQQRAI